MASFRPPILPGSDATNARRSDLPAWVLLDTSGQVDERENTTVARTLTSNGQEVAVSFFTAEPPVLSHFSIHCPGLTRGDFSADILHSEDNLVLLTLSLRSRVIFHAAETEYLVYSAAGRTPTLKLVQNIGRYFSELPQKPSTANIGFVPIGDCGEHFVLAALGYAVIVGQYEVHVFRSEPEPGTWTCHLLVVEPELAAYGRMEVKPEKMITLGGGKIGWVDPWSGILVCNVVDESPALSFIPLPILLPANQVDLHECSYSARHFRDVVCVDGVIRCVEQEICRRRVVRQIPDVSSADVQVLHDSELWWDPREEEKEEEEYEYLGWRIIVWDRPISSKLWRKRGLVHVEDILANSSPSDCNLQFPDHQLLLLGEKKSAAGSLTLEDLLTSYPTLSMDDGDVVYLTCKQVHYDHMVSRAVTINMRDKRALELVPLPSGCTYGTKYIPCALSKYLNTGSDN